MRFTISFDLGNLIERLPTRTRFGIALCQGLAGDGIDLREHEAITQVAVMRQRQQLTSGLLFIRLHPFPQVFGVKTFRSREW